jgi:hypothetical protein
VKTRRAARRTPPTARKLLPREEAAIRELVTREEAADFLRIDVRTLMRMVARDTLKVALKTSAGRPGRVLFRLRDLRRLAGLEGASA